MTKRERDLWDAAIHEEAARTADAKATRLDQQHRHKDAFVQRDQAAGFREHARNLRLRKE